MRQPRSDHDRAREAQSARARRKLRKRDQHYEKLQATMRAIKRALQTQRVKLEDGSMVPFDQAWERSAGLTLFVKVLLRMHGRDPEKAKPCLLFKGPKTKKGYGRIRLKTKSGWATVSTHIYVNWLYTKKLPTNQHAVTQGTVEMIRERAEKKKAQGLPVKEPKAPMDGHAICHLCNQADCGEETHLILGSFTENESHKLLASQALMAAKQIESQGWSPIMADKSAPWYSANDPWNQNIPQEDGPEGPAEA